MIDAISPIDGRYANKTKDLKAFYSEEALIKYRVLVEVRYFLHLSDIGVIQLSEVEKTAMNGILENFTSEDALSIKEIEKVTNHDVKAVEYHIKNMAQGQVSNDHIEFVHFALTSQDINNTAMPLMLMNGIGQVILPELVKVKSEIMVLANRYRDIALLARTHGQTASPTSLGKEMMVYVDRLEKQIAKLKSHHYEAKFGGATGNFNAHKIAYPDIDWPDVADQFIISLGLKRQRFTTQIDQYDNMAEVFHTLVRVNTILVDFAQDIWTYVSRDYFKQKVVANEVGSSAMPHKVNPIDFENAEGNLGVANALLEFLARKLPISRLQRDLTDSTVTRNIGVPLAHSLIAYKSLLKGIGKLEVNKAVISKDLEDAWAVVSEGIQTVLRREGFEKPYELLKEFSRGKGKLNKEDFAAFIETLEVSPTIKAELGAITPHNYIGYSNRF